jgi:two-component system sensor histidine kinase KdpD
MRDSLGISRRELSRGALASLGMIALVTIALLPLRGTLGPSTVALLLVVPLVASIAVGGIAAGIVATLVGFLSYDYFFIPPYNTLVVGRTANWVPLGVYVAVGAITVVINARFRVQRRRARAMTELLERLATLPSLFIGEVDARQLQERFLTRMVKLAELSGAALLVPEGQRLRPTTIAGDAELASAIAARAIGPDGLGRVGPVTLQDKEVRLLELGPSRSRQEILAIWAPSIEPEIEQALRVIAGQFSAALESAELRETRIRLDILQQIDEWRSSLLRTVSHDLLTPLAGIKTAMSTLEEFHDALEPSDRKLLVTTSLAQADRSIQLVTDLLNMTRIEAGAFELQLQPTELARLVDEVALAIDFVSLQVDFSLVTAPETTELLVDAGLIREVVWNLLENAVRHSPTGGRVEIVIERRGPWMVVRVRDEGQLPPCASTTLFDWFHRLGQGGRSGLGLAIARSFVEAHGGTLGIRSTLEGTEFYFELPVVPSPHSAHELAAPSNGLEPAPREASA